ncbi:hypothetical protein [Streptomyces lavendofoliae]|uniref:hypothetical protein n=1 Tax=Streptomyces lavendofoliae TaxID=67314 RepID=UPI003AF14375
MTNTAENVARGRAPGGPRDDLRKDPRDDLRELRRLMALMTGDEKHGPAAPSTLDALWVLYDRVLRVSPATADAPGRDRFLLSKGHGPMAYYAVLTAKGSLSEDLLPGSGSYDSPLGHHPGRLLVPGAGIGSGSLGHGLPLAVSGVLGLRARRPGRHGPLRHVGAPLRRRDRTARGRRHRHGGRGTRRAVPRRQRWPRPSWTSRTGCSPWAWPGGGCAATAGRMDEHLAAHGLDPRSLRDRVGAFPRR